MAVRARVTAAQTEKPARDEREIEALISRGGIPAIAEHQGDQRNVEIKFTLRLIKAVMDQIDTEIRTRPGKVSRNQWIVEAIAERLQRDDDGRITSQ